jgi:hypothetical protein
MGTDRLAYRKPENILLMPLAQLQQFSRHLNDTARRRPALDDPPNTTYHPPAPYLDLRTRRTGPIPVTDASIPPTIRHPQA